MAPWCAGRGAAPGDAAAPAARSTGAAPRRCGPVPSPGGRASASSREPPAPDRQRRPGRSRPRWPGRPRPAAAASAPSGPIRPSWPRPPRRARSSCSRAGLTAKRRSVARSSAAPARPGEPGGPAARMPARAAHCGLVRWPRSRSSCRRPGRDRRRAARPPERGCRRRGLLAGHRVADHRGPEQADGGLELAELDPAAAAGPVPMHQRGQQRDQRVTRIRHVVGIVRAGADREPVRQSRRLDQAGEGGDGRAEAGVVRLCGPVAPCIGMVR